MSEQSQNGGPKSTPLGDNAGVHVPTPESAGPRLEFGDFLMSLGTSAYVSLGKIQDPAFGTSEPDLPAAKQIIDILEMLREKTRGNLHPEEDRLLSGLIYELQMAYLESR
jgi:hypothetical protein